MELAILFITVIICSLITLTLLAPTHLALPHLPLWSGLAIGLPVLAWLIKD